MSGAKIIEGLKEAVAVMKGEEPAAEILVNGHTYVPKARLSQIRQAMLDDILSCRGIDDQAWACDECAGLGVKSYGDTSTWHGGIGGQAFTSDVCDKCWGSGNKHKPWPSHREFQRLKKQDAALSSIRKEG